MPRVREIEEAGGDETLAKLFERDLKVFGYLLNPTKVMAHCPPILEAAKAMGAAIDRSGQLPPSMIALVYLRVASINGCPF
jgi:alkylhydroperoxidase family enzyme